jgi:hypothetical protein
MEAIMASDLTISTFLSVELEFVDSLAITFNRAFLIKQKI